MQPRISVVAALGKDRAIGKQNQLLWNIPDDLKRFKHLTSGHPVIMGRRTYESIFALLGKPLPGRTSIVLCYPDEAGHMKFRFENVFLVHSIEKALAKARSLDGEEVFVGGGAMLYEQMLPYADRLYLTLIEDEKDGDVFFPPYEDIFTKTVADEPHEFNGLKYRFVTLEK